MRDFLSVSRDGIVAKVTTYTGYPAEVYIVTCGDKKANISQVPVVLPAYQDTNVYCTIMRTWNNTASLVANGTLYIPDVPGALRLVAIDIMKVTFEWDTPQTSMLQTGLVCCGKPEIACLDGGLVWKMHWRDNNGTFALSPGSNYTCQVILSSQMNGEIWMQAGLGLNISMAPAPRIVQSPKVDDIYVEGDEVVMTTYNVQEGLYYAPVCVTLGTGCASTPAHLVPIAAKKSAKISLPRGKYSCFFIALSGTQYTCGTRKDFEF